MKSEGDGVGGGDRGFVGSGGNSLGVGIVHSGYRAHAGGGAVDELAILLIVDAGFEGGTEAAEGAEDCERY